MAVGVARKTLLEEPLRFALAVAGVALAVMLILVLNGLYDGIGEQITGYLDHAPAELVVAQEGLRDFLGTRSSLPVGSAEVVEDVGGVRRVTPVVVQYVVLELRGRKEFTLLVGFDPAEGGGPWDVAKGTSDVEPGEVVLDAALARLRGLGLGDRMDILGEEFEIVGLSAGTSTFMTGTAFVHYRDAARLVRARGPSFLLLTLDPGLSAAAVIERVEAEAPRTTVSTRARVNRNDQELFAGILKGPVAFMVAVAFLVGVLLVGLMTYTATVERSKDYGALKAIGAPSARLYLVVLQQAGLSTALGSALGVGLAFAAAELIAALNPRFLVVIGLRPVAAVFAAALLMGVLAALAPTAALARIDPAIAFRRGV